MNTTIVTLLGKWPLSHAWVRPCIHSWQNIKDVTRHVNVISDGSLEPADLLNENFGMEFRYSSDQDLQVESALVHYPSLKKIRTQDLTWRKILDPIILFRDYPRLLIIDTDVLIRKPISLPSEKGLFYLREDIPAYQGSPLLPWIKPIVRSFNAGFVLVEPSQISLDFLEEVTRQYLLQLKNFWWSEQLAWSLCAGRADERYFWKGSSAVTLSGFRTRTTGEIKSDVVKFVSSKQALTGQEIVEHAGEARVLHLAGKGKHHWSEFSVSYDAPVLPLEYEVDPLISLRWKLAISLRLLGKTIFS